MTARAAVLVGVGAALGLVALLGATWYDVEFVFPGGAPPDSTSVSGWTVLHGADVWIAILSSASALLLLIGERLTRLAALGCAVGALGLVIYHMVELPGENNRLAQVDLAVGIWLSLAAAVLLTAAMALATTRRSGHAGSVAPARGEDS